jgi:hypothetical protein
VGNLLIEVVLESDRDEDRVLVSMLAGALARRGLRVAVVVPGPDDLPSGVSGIRHSCGREFAEGRCALAAAVNSINARVGEMVADFVIVTGYIGALSTQLTLGSLVSAGWAFAEIREPDFTLCLLPAGPGSASIVEERATSAGWALIRIRDEADDTLADCAEAIRDFRRQRVPQRRTGRQSRVQKRDTSLAEFSKILDEWIS